MSYSDIVEVLAKITTDTTEVDSAQKAVDKVSKDWVSTREQIMQQLPKVANLVNKILYATKRVMRTLNVAIDPLVDAVISGALAIISAAVSMQHAFVGMGPAGWILIALNAIFLFLAIYEAGQAIILAGRAKLDAQDANERIQSIQEVFVDFRGMMGAMY